METEELEVPMTAMGVNSQLHHCQQHEKACIFVKAVSTSHGSQDMEPTEMAIDRGLDEEEVVHIHNRILRP